MWITLRLLLTTFAVSAVVWLTSHATYRINPRLAPGEYDAAYGATLFRNRCARCHALSVDESGGTGPTLDRLAEVLPLPPAEYLLQSILDPKAFRRAGVSGEMPVGLARDLPDSDIKSLVAFLLRNIKSTDADRLSELDVKHPPTRPQRTTAIDRQTVEFGESLFRDKGLCAKCHSFHMPPEFTLSGPSLFHAGYDDPDYLLQSITEPSKEIHPRYVESQVVLEDGRTLIGRLSSRKDSQRCSIITYGVNNQAYLSDLDPTDIESGDDDRPLIKKLNKSPMPDGYSQVLDLQELTALIAFIMAVQ